MPPLGIIYHLCGHLQAYQAFGDDMGIKVHTQVQTPQLTLQPCPGPTLQPRQRKRGAAPCFPAVTLPPYGFCRPLRSVISYRCCPGRFSGRARLRWSFLAGQAGHGAILPPLGPDVPSKYLVCIGVHPTIQVLLVCTCTEIPPKKGQAQRVAALAHFSTPRSGLRSGSLLHVR